MRNGKRLVFGLLLFPFCSFASPSNIYDADGTAMSVTIRSTTSSSTTANLTYLYNNYTDSDYGYFVFVTVSSSVANVGNVNFSVCDYNGGSYNNCSLIYSHSKSSSTFSHSFYVPPTKVLYANITSAGSNGTQTISARYLSNSTVSGGASFVCPTCPECPTCPDTPDDSECQEQLAQLSGDYNVLSEQYASLLMYNSSIESQLQQCLMSGGNSILSGMCSSLDLFWFNNDQMYSVPITNNLVLPNGFRALVDSGVQSIVPIQTLDYAYEMDDDEFQKVIDGYGIVFLFFFSSALFLVFIYYIRKYFIGLKN